MLKSAENKDGHAEKNPPHGLVFPIDHDGKIHENTAEKRSDKGFRHSLRELSLAKRQRLLAKGRHGIPDSDAGGKGADKVAEQGQQQRRNVRLCM